MTDDVAGIVKRLRERALIRRRIDTRKSVQEGKPDRLADQLDEASDLIERLSAQLAEVTFHHNEASRDRATFAQLHNVAVQQLAERDAELAEERTHAEAMEAWLRHGTSKAERHRILAAYRAYRGTK